MRAGVGARYRIDCCGPGASAVIDWAGTLQPARRPVLLAGLAGALTGTFRPGTAHLAGEVVDAETTQRWMSSLSYPSRDAARPEGCVVASAGAAVMNPAEKEALARRVGADLVDLESAAFARSAEDAGRWWAVVRGVADGVDTALPPGVDRWVDQNGRTRHVAVAATIAARPRLLPSILRLRHSSITAMQAVAELLLSLLER
ncbi:MAG: hypothetical protein JSV91_08250 [Phycisphaerales bacterium]|nr:MAG: hypothetical protein JSV91_08250 [Phycisphaerales bacterium]